MKETVIQLLTAFLGSLGFSVLFGLRRRYLIAASLGGMAGWGIYLLVLALTEESFIACLAASAFAGVYAELLARRFKAPATLFLIPAIVPMVPGGSLYYAMSYAVRGQRPEARQAAVTTLKLALAIASGISFVTACRELRAKRSGR